MNTQYKNLSPQPENNIRATGYILKPEGLRKFFQGEASRFIFMGKTIIKFTQRFGAALLLEINQMSKNAKKEQLTPVLSDDTVLSKIFLVREQRVMLDRDLAMLYGTETKVLKQAVRRNIRRFPEDFMFEMTQEEFENWRSQIVTSSSDRKGLRYRPYCFTELCKALHNSVYVR